MGNCLITKLKAAVDNGDLKKLGVLTLSIKSLSSADYTNNPNSTYFTLIVNDAVEVKVVGDGYIGISSGDRTHESLQLSAGTTNIYLSNANFKVEISNKYAITTITCSGSFSCPSMVGLDITELDYVTGLTALTNSYNNAKVYGDISALVKASPLATLRLDNSNITGDVTNVSAAVTGLGGTKIYGDFTKMLKATTQAKPSFFKGLNSTQMRDGEMSVDMSQAPAVVTFLDSTNTNEYIKCRWSNTRASANNIIAMYSGWSKGFNFGTDLDAMLINQANCTAVSGATGNEAKIVVHGTRTSASDSAVATLKSKGYSISVNNVEL